MCSFFSFLFKKEKVNKEVITPLIPQDGFLVENIYKRNKFYPKYHTILDVVDERIINGLDTTTTVEDYGYLCYKNNLIVEKIKKNRERMENLLD